MASNKTKSKTKSRSKSKSKTRSKTISKNRSKSSSRSRTKKQKAAIKIQRMTRKRLLEKRKKKALEKINKGLIRLKKKQDLCPICLEKISKADRWETKCGHFFHKRCLDNWCYINAKKNIMCRCPLCKQKLEEMTELNKAIANRIRERDSRRSPATIRAINLRRERLQQRIRELRSNQNNN